MATRTNQKTERIAKTRDRRPTAYARYIRISPFKVRLVCDIVRGKSVGDALAILEATPRAGSPILSKLISSAVANAEHNLNLSRDDLFVSEIFADGGPTLKRVMPRAQGRAYRIAKRTSHITVKLDVKEVK